MASSDPKPGQTLTALARYGFTDLEQTVSKLDVLVKLIGDAGRSALAQLSLAANPDQALDYLIRLAELDRQRLKKLLSKEDSSLRLIRVLGASEALAEFLVRKPDYLSQFEKPEAKLKSRTELDAAMASGAAHSKTPFDSAAEITRIRQNYRKALLDIAIFDLSQSDQIAGLTQLAKALSDLAGATLDEALRLARAEILGTVEFGRYEPFEVENTALAVIGMGKGGAGELNYISDVDVIFVAESRSEELANERMLEIATKIATRMMRIMDSTNPEPALWQVDANLRPEGKSGALVRTLDSHLAYYDRWAENWEFQALLKAKPIAGDVVLGQKYYEQINPLVWSSSKRDNFVESVQRMRERVTDNIPQDELDWQIKLGVGGLRDIEFTVQLLQLVHGREDESVRAPDTVTAITQLARAGYIGRAEANQFAEHYKFLRLLEHRIQLRQMRRTHLMPRDTSLQRVIARSVDAGLTSEGLIEKWSKVKLDVRSLHQRIFYRPLLVAVSKTEGSLSLSADQVKDRLEAIGFRDAAGASQHIQALTGGISRRAQIQKQLLPVLLEWFAQGTDPDSALLAFRRLSENLGDSPWYLRMLRDSSGAAERLSNCLSNSRLATSLLELIPEGAAWFEDSKLLLPVSKVTLLTESDSLGQRHADLQDYAKQIRHIRRRETLRLALGAVSGDLDLAGLSFGLTQITEWYLSVLIEKIISTQSYGEEKICDLLDFGVIAMGRFGGGELGFGSDADVMFVYEPKPGIAISVAQKAAEQIINDLRTLSRDPQLEFEIDLDLRPEGKNGPVARSVESYAAYYSRWSDVWENQALLRARMVYGEEKLRGPFSDIVDKYRYPEVLEDKSIVEIRRIKARMESERLPLGVDSTRHMKLGRGSLSDIEWVIQLMQLKHGNQFPEIRTPETLKALDALVEHGLIEQHDARVLREAWVFCSRVRSASMLWSNKRSDVLPTDRRHLEGMARILEYPRGSASLLEEEYLAKTRRARMVFEKLFFA
ncbi:MAG: bifunctional [glutamine synthetase] adenylyltransferase/[glutamine synthetase]-adenylyl-L-tyrosine phosphorylase [Rhodoluna sp.]